jgi:hypothetical protein
MEGEMDLIRGIMGREESTVVFYQGPLYWMLFTTFLTFFTKKFGSDVLFDYFGKPQISATKFVIGQGEFVVDIEARTSGIWGWLKNQLKLDLNQMLKVTKNQVIYTASSVSGKINIVAPLKVATGTRVGYARNFILLKWAIVGILTSLIAWLLDFSTLQTFLIGIGLSAAVIVWFWYTKRLLLVIDISDSMPIWFVFKEAHLDGITINSQLVMEAGISIDKAILAAKQERTPSDIRVRR